MSCLLSLQQESCGTLRSSGDLLDISPTFTDFAAEFCRLLDVPMDGVTLIGLVRAIKFLFSCKYERGDVSTLLAMTVIHHSRLVGSLSQPIPPIERSFIVISQMYITHCYVFDYNCKLVHWWRCLLRGYCPKMPVLNRSISLILELMNFDLSLNAGQYEQFEEIRNIFDKFHVK
jgi:hypothetical protein